jgi:hypothetical protein
MIGWATALLAVVLVPGPARTASAATTALDTALRDRLASIESAFRKSDARRLDAALPRRGRIRIDIEGLTAGQAYYGPDQIRVVLREIFDRTRTQQFAFRVDDARLSADGSAFVRSRWRWQDRESRLEKSLTLTFTLRREAGAWRIHTIRSSR